MVFPRYAEINDDYLDDGQTAEELMEQLNLPMDRLLQAIESKLLDYEQEMRERGDNNFVLHVGPQVGLRHWLPYKKFDTMLRKIYDPEQRTAFGKSFELLLLYFFLAVVCLGMAIFIFAMGYRYYNCNEFSDTLLKRIGKIQNEKMNLLKIIDGYTYQNVSFFEQVREDDA